MIYRRIVLDVASEGDEDQELLPAILVTAGAVESPFIGGTGIQIIDTTEIALKLVPQA